MGKKSGTRWPGILFGIILTALFGAAALALTWKIADYLIDERESLDYWGDLQSSVIIADTEQAQQDEKVEHWPVTDGQEQAVEDPGEETPFEGIAIPAAIDFNILHAISDNAVAWIFSPDTVINYVIAQSKDNAYYLNHLLDGTAASGGSLFMDYRANAGFSDWNTVIYGHQMNNGTMFGSLSNYRDPAYYEQHPVMYLYVPGKRFTLELIAGYTTDIYDPAFDPAISREKRNALLARAVARSTFQSGVTAGEEDRLVTLSTCAYDYNNARYVVIGRLVEDHQ